jgi:hypothetical protein
MCNMWFTWNIFMINYYDDIFKILTTVSFDQKSGEIE